MFGDAVTPEFWTTVRHLLLWQGMVCAIIWAIIITVALVASTWMRCEQRRSRLRSRVKP